MTTTSTISNARRWTMLACSLVAAMTTAVVVGGVAYLIPALHTQQGMSLAQASVLATIPTIGLMIAIVGWGTLLDRYGERTILLISVSITLVGTSAAAITAAAHASYVAIAACLFIAGVGSGAANGASGRIVVGWFPPELRGTAMGIRQMAQPLGIGVCALTMPVIAASHSVAAALAVPAVVTAIGLAAVVFGVIDPPAPSTTGTTAPAQRRNPYRESSFLARVHAVSVLLVIPQQMLWTFVPTWLIVARHWSPAAAGILVTITQVIGALGRIAAGRWSDAWLSRMRPIRLIAIGAAAAMVLLAVTDWLHTPLAPALMMIASIITVADNGLAFTAIAEYAGPQWSGRGLAIQNTAQYLATAATTPLFGLLIGAAGFPLAFLVSAAAPVVATPLIPKDALSQEELVA